MTPKIVITLEGGIIQSIDSNIPTEVIVLDYDSDAKNDPKESSFTDLSGDEQEAIVTIHKDNNKYPSEEIVEHVFKQLG